MASSITQSWNKTLFFLANSMHDNVSIALLHEYCFTNKDNTSLLLEATLNKSFTTLYFWFVSAWVVQVVAGEQLCGQKILLLYYYISSSNSPTLTKYITEHGTSNVQLCIISHFKCQKYLIFTKTMMLLQVNFQIFLWNKSYFSQLPNRKFEVK